MRRGGRESGPTRRQVRDEWAPPVNYRYPRRHDWATRQDQFGQSIQFGGLDFWDKISVGSTDTCKLTSFDTTCTPANTGPCGKLTFSTGTFNDSYNICSPHCKSSSGSCITGCSTGATQIYYVNGFAINKPITYACNAITTQ